MGEVIEAEEDARGEGGRQPGKPHVRPQPGFDRCPNESPAHDNFSDRYDDHLRSMRERESGAQLLVMGGYGHSRIRDFVLGGATRGVLSDLRLPVLLSH